MTQPEITPFTWEIDNFVSLVNYKESSIFNVNQQHNFWVAIIPSNQLKYMQNHIMISLYRGPPREADVKVLWTISLINDKGEECYPKVLESSYKTKDSYTPIDASSYLLDRTIILDPSRGLLPGDKLTVKCTVRVIDDQSRMNCVKLSIDIQKLTLAHKKARENYQSLLENPKFSDVVFVIGKKEFKLHKNILSVQSPVFSAMFENDLKEAQQNRVEITDVDVEVFEAMINFIYTTNVDSVQHYALDLFVAADKYQLDTLKDICAQSLNSNLTIDSVAKIFLIADMHSAQELKSKCIEFINKNTAKVFVTEGWKHLVKSRQDLVVELYYDVTKFETK